MALTVLVIDDDRDDFLIIKELLEAQSEPSIDLLWADNDEAGLKLLMTEDIDVAIVDVYIGPVSGLTFVRNMHEIGCGIPMILITGANDDELDRSARASGASFYLEKQDLTADRLERAVRYSLAQKPARNAGAEAMMQGLTADHDRQGPFVQPTCLPRPGLDETATPGPRSAAREGSSTIAGSATPQVPRILMIEDDQDDYYLTRELLAEVFGGALDLEWASSWKSGQEAIGRGEHDVVIIDFRLGDKNGLELVNEAIHLDCRAPFIVLTGENDRETDLAAMRAGATDYLVKGEITAHLLDRAIRYAIERHRAELRLTELAQFDQLTGLANRYLFRDFLTRSLERAKRHDHYVALLLIDLDRFKAVNDTYGHGAGDRLLQRIADRLKQWVRRGDLVARLGGDEFTIVLTDIEDVDRLGAKAEQIAEILKTPVDIGVAEVDVGGSIGIAVFPGDADTVDELIVSADTAMYAAKQQRSSSYHFYTSEMRSRASRRLELEKGLREALVEDQFELVYQPQIDLDNGSLIGFEALLRWHHPKLGRVSPSEFIKLAEESSLILPIGDWVIETSCSQLAAWRDAGLPPVHVAVNFSARQFNDPSLAERVAHTLQRYDLAPEWLEVEITESDILQQPIQVRELLKQFAEHGIRVALDDFGTGYSSLNHLRSFPGALIKIDQSFIHNITSDAHDLAIVQSVIAMAHNLDLKVVAEGVERADQLAYLLHQGCDVVQGFYFGRPMPVSDITPEFFAKRFLQPGQTTDRLVRMDNQPTLQRLRA
ncbi:MAG: EAL domain-containing protein [Geminicoccaceae bacterium]